MLLTFALLPLSTNPSFSEVARSSTVHPNGYTVHQATYLSIPMPLKPGQVVFTKYANILFASHHPVSPDRAFESLADSPRQTPITMPPTGSMITGFTGEVVDAENRSMPLTFVYDHHWIAVDPEHKNDLCTGFENYVFGIGAESRNSPQKFPSGYGYRMGAEGGRWGGNIHLLHTQNLSTVYSEGSLDLAAKQCVECYYAPGKGDECTPGRNGTFQCCGAHEGSGANCPTTIAAHLLPATTFYLRYTVWYVAPIQANMLKEVRVGVWTTPNCAAYYQVHTLRAPRSRMSTRALFTRTRVFFHVPCASQVLRNDEQPETLSRTSFTIPHAASIVHAVGHQHTGAINVSMWHNDKFVCASYPTYGNETDVPGNERGHLVKM